MDKIEIIDKNRELDKFLILIKFGKMENLRKLQDGNLYMKNLKYYNELEEHQNLVGMGDKYDGKFTMSNVNFKFMNIGTDEVVLTGESKETIFDFNYTNNPIFCLFSMDKRNIVGDGILSEDMIKYKLEFTEKQKREIKENFGDSALIISNPEEFFNRIKKSFEKEDINFRRGRVYYYDKFINNKKMLDSIFENSENTVFWKEKSIFDYQHEYRIFVTNIKVEDYKQIEIGDIKDITHIMTMDELFGTYGVLSFHYYNIED